MSADERTDLRIPRDGHTLAAWHYPAAPSELCDGDGRAPAVILGHGYSLTRDCGLDRYAEQFSAAGIHALVIDYTGFGDSDGEPRDVVSVTSQLRDYECTIAAVRSIDGIDPDRIALWGTSYSGGLVVAAAAADRRIAAVIAQVPNLDNLATLRFLVAKNPARHMSWLSAAVTRDVTRALTRRPPFYVRAMGPAGTRSAYVSDQSWEEVSAIAGPQWHNRVGLRDFASLPVFRAVSRLDRLPCRIQLFAADHDDLTPVAPTLAAARRLGARAELHRVAAGHFGIYADPHFGTVIEQQVRFLSSELSLG
ncbi:MAG: alpha/beta fold hydrolase [Gordonia sp. (in: high G+C Gram-positive bacteria)]|uniref:alpha/beta hydrolase n=1 Tax=Gordonia sp. (in: high G+C Gram-positive bacteria) TaxID=84139 RepID=UPI0039E221C7